ncbi:DUF2306 domain-containing protein [Shinella kummerowiae]|jgi:uncharacterized membrane protein|uniref:DUF2306 domain-containing protein n=1 Tax=Shinella kummerowiae TaxID=417745 RepID=A0A6N8S543_9HYPH|nr:DUF2306 domain-containing protein [Shinella kummerowiae]MXN44185.1 DUF2306 domain-containing protein [Shinella kummerowiae]
MTIEPLLNAPIAVQFHVATVLPAAVLGAVLLARRKGTPAHRLLGKIWLVLMVVTSFSTFFIHDLKTVGNFSPIHLLSIYVIVGSIPAIRAARRGDIRAHRAQVAGMYFGGIVVAGLFTLVPHRVMGAIIFDGASGFVSGVAAALVCVLLVAAGALAIREAGWLERFETFRRR